MPFDRGKVSIWDEIHQCQCTQPSPTPWALHSQVLQVVGGEGKKKGQAFSLTGILSAMAGGQEGQRYGAGSTLGGSEPLCWDRGNGQGALNSEPGAGALPEPLHCWQQHRPTF